MQKKKKSYEHKNTAINNSTTSNTTWVDQLNDCDSSIIQEI